MDAYSVCHGQKIGEFVESELPSVTSDGRVAPASRPSLNANPDSRQSIHTADMVDLENEDIKETIQSELLRNTSNVKVTPASPSSLNTTQITCQSIHTVDVVDLENEDIKETVQSDIGTHRGTGYSFTSNQLQENSYNAEPFTISTRPSNLQKGDVVELTSDGSEGVQQGSNYKVIRLNNPPSLQSLVRSPGQGEELEDGEIVDADAGAGQIPRTGTGYSLTHNQLCESFVDSNTRLVGTKFFQPEKPSIITTTSDCQVTFGPLLKPLAVLFSFYFPDLNASMGIIVPKDSEEYKLEPVSPW